MPFFTPSYFINLLDRAVYFYNIVAGLMTSSLLELAQDAGIIDASPLLPDFLIRFLSSFSFISLVLASVGVVIVLRVFKTVLDAIPLV